MSEQNKKPFVGARHRAEPTSTNIWDMMEQGGQAPPPAKKNNRRPIKKKKKKAWLKVILSLFLMFVLVAGVGIIGLYAYLKQGLISDEYVQQVNPAFATPGAWKGKTINILILGLDNNSDRGFAKGDGLTDMVLLMHWDLTTNKASFLQVPRDSQVSGGLKINSVLRLGQDKENPVNNVLGVFNEQFLLPVDRYVMLDMDSLKELVTALGGLDVYIPKPLNDYAGSALPQGLHHLDGEQVEFFVRVRKGAGMDRSDIDRLENQRYFYSALFRRLLQLSIKDITHLMPVINEYFITNFTVPELMPLALNGLRLKSENITFASAPVTSYGASAGNLTIDLYGNGSDENPGLANILNTYFRTLDLRAPIDAAALGLPQVAIPAGVSVYPPGIQSMGEMPQE